MTSNFGQHPTHVGDQIAASVGAVQYEEDAGKSLSGGSAPTTGQSIHNPISGSGGIASAAHTEETNPYQTSTQFQGTPQPQGASNLGASSPQVTDVGLNTSGLTSTKPQEASGNLGGSQGTGNLGSGSTGPLGKSSATETQGTATTGSAAGGAPPAGDGTLYDQAARGAHVAAVKAQELSQPIQPYIQKVQETVAPYVQTAVENASPYVQQAREAAAPIVEKASELASQGIQATAAELDKRGVNVETIQQGLKDYGAAGQARAGEYFQQAVDQASNINSDKENRNILATVFGTIALIWLAFGFSITALLAVGIAGGIAAILSRYSRAAVGTRSHAEVSGNRPLSTSGVETHYPNPSHPDNSLNN